MSELGKRILRATGRAQPPPFDSVQRRTRRRRSTQVVSVTVVTGGVVAAAALVAACADGSARQSAAPPATSVATTPQPAQTSAQPGGSPTPSASSALSGFAAPSIGAGTGSVQVCTDLSVTVATGGRSWVVTATSKPVVITMPKGSRVTLDAAGSCAARVAYDPGPAAAFLWTPGANRISNGGDPASPHVDLTASRAARAVVSVEVTRRLPDLSASYAERVAYNLYFQITPG